MLSTTLSVVDKVLVPLALVLLGIALGGVAGSRYARAHRGWADFRKTKASLPGLRKDAWALTRRAAGAVLAVAAFFIIFLAAAANAGSGGS